MDISNHFNFSNIQDMKYKRRIGEKLTRDRLNSTNIKYLPHASVRRTLPGTII